MQGTLAELGLEHWKHESFSFMSMQNSEAPKRLNCTLNPYSGLTDETSIFVHIILKSDGT